uniref:SKP1 component and Exonuclease domain containing protein n=1 Tax=Haemonchus contortus TaxID=6289 RepID=W6NB46_HAECO
MEQKKTDTSSAQKDEASEKPDAVKVVTKDDCVFHVPRDVIHMSKTINTMISDLGVDSNDPIPICNVNGATMKKVLDWCAHHKNDPPLTEDKNKTRTSEISAWDKQFFSVDQETVFELILAANYLDISGLLDVVCRVVANMINGKTPDEIRRTFNIINDFSPEEEARIRKENAWRLPYNECVEESAEELAEYYEKLLRVSEELEEKRKKEGLPDLYNPDGTAKVRTEIPPENILKRVEYEEPPKGVEVETLIAVMRRLHSLTAAEMRTFLKQVHQSGQGTKKQLRARLRRYYRKEFSMYRMLREGDNMPRFGNKTARYFDFLVAIDFECTCVEVIYDYPHEIIEFPAVLIDVRQMKIVDKFRTFVRPEKNPILDPFCIQLTGISQSMVDSAPVFKDAYRLFRDWMAHHNLGDVDHRYAFVTDGPHDLWKFFQFQCILSDFGTIPHDCRHFINIKRIFEQRVMKLVKGNGQSGIQNMLSHYNLTFEGQKHCGLDDSINIARLCIKLMQDKIELRINQRMTRRQDRIEERRLEELAKSDRADASDYHIWYKKLPLKLRQVTRDEFLSEEYLDCDSCDEVDE